MNILSRLHVLLYVVIFQFRLILPYWILGVLLGTAISVFAGNNITALVSKLRGKKYKFSTALFAAILGAVSPLCMYGTVPLIAALCRKGIPQSLLAAFMISSILINPNLFFVSIALGVPIAVLRLCLSIAAGVVAGALIQYVFKRAPVFYLEDFMDRRKHTKERTKLEQFFYELNRTIIKTAPYLLIGITLTAVISQYFPQQITKVLFKYNKTLGVFIAASAGVPLYLCGGGTVPLIKTWLDGGMSIGAASAFMLTGPATKINNLSAVKSILGKKNFMFYLCFNLIFAVVIGWGINIVLFFIRNV